MPKTRSIRATWKSRCLIIVSKGTDASPAGELTTVTESSGQSSTSHGYSTSSRPASSGRMSVVQTCCSTVSGRGLAGCLDEQRDRGDLAEVSRHGLAAVQPLPEGDAVVGGDDHRRVVPQSLALQPVDDDVQQGVGVADLEQVTLEGDVDDRVFASHGPSFGSSPDHSLLMLL